MELGAPTQKIEKCPYKCGTLSPQKIYQMLTSNGIKEWKNSHYILVLPKTDSQANAGGHNINFIFGVCKDHITNNIIPLEYPPSFWGLTSIVLTTNMINNFSLCSNGEKCKM